MTNRPCTTPGCDRPRIGRGLCQRHYNKWYASEAASGLRKLGEPSKSEHAVLLAIAQGWGIHQIARALKVSSTTVSTFRRRLLRKLKLKTDAELAVYARESGLTKWPFEMPPPALAKRRLGRGEVRA